MYIVVLWKFFHCSATKTLCNNNSIAGVWLLSKWIAPMNLLSNKFENAALSANMAAFFNAIREILYENPIDYLFYEASIWQKQSPLSYRRVIYEPELLILVLPSQEHLHNASNRYWYYSTHFSSIHSYRLTMFMLERISSYQSQSKSYINHCYMIDGPGLIWMNESFNMVWQPWNESLALRWRCVSPTRVYPRLNSFLDRKFFDLLFCGEREITFR